MRVANRARARLGFGLALFATATVFTVGATPLPSFSPTIDTAMRAVQKVAHVPLVAPTWTPTVGPDDIARRGFLTVETQLTATSYILSLTYTRVPVPVNAQQWWRYDLTPKEQSYAGLSVAQYPTHEAAEVAIRGEAGVRFFTEPTHPHHVVLLPGVVAASFVQPSTEDRLLVWTQGRWAVYLSATPDTPFSHILQVARAATQKAPSCPGRAGILTINLAGGSNWQAALWTIGRMAYGVGSRYGINPIYHLMPSLRPWSAPLGPQPE